MVALLYAALLIGTHEGLPVKVPTAVGMSAQRLAAIDRVVGRGIDAGGYPGAAVVVGRKGAAVWERGYGRLGWNESDEAVTPNRTIYDLASLTKVVGTTTAVMLMYDEGRLELDAPVSRYLPAFTGGFKDSVTIRHLLQHRSGLPPGRDLWRLAHNPQEARLGVIDAQLVCKPGDCYIYSDLGADLLGMVVETVAAKGLDQLLQERVFGPLGMSDTFYRPADSLRYRIAPTEVSPPRGYPLRGEVHDENAFALGGVAGHAGLFSTAEDLSIFAQMMLNGGEYSGVRILQPSTVALFTRRAAGTRGLGWDTCAGAGGCGTYLTERAYGHTGFTGTSIWIDPDREMFVILLTNRVHEARALRPAKVISDVRADLADAAALAVIDAPAGVMTMPVAFRSDRATDWNKAVRSRHSRRGRHTRGHPTVKSHGRPSRGSKASHSSSTPAHAETTSRHTPARVANHRPASTSHRARPATTKRATSRSRG